MGKIFYVYLEQTGTADPADITSMQMKVLAKSKEHALTAVKSDLTVVDVLTPRECQRRKDGVWKRLQGTLSVLAEGIQA